MIDLTPDNPPTLGILGGDCQCGRGQTIGTCIVTASRLWFRAFHDGPAAYHLERCTDWACVDCIADNALAVANGEVRDRMHQEAQNKGAYVVTAYSSDRNYHLKRADYSKTVRDEPRLPPAKERAEKLARELADRSHRQRLGWRRITVTPATTEPA